jgi:hypothetical protein
MSLEYKKKQMELKRVTLAKDEMELKIEERLSEIEKLKEAIRTQEMAENKLTNELKEIKG